MNRRWLLIALVLLLAAPLALMLQGFVRDVATIEFLRALWAGRILLESLPQMPLWGLFLVTLSLIAAKSLIKGKSSAREEPQTGPGDLGRVQSLAQEIERSGEGEYFKWRIARDLGELVMEVLAHRQRLDAGPLAARQELEKQELDAPPEIQAFLRAGSKPAFSRPGNLLAWLRDSLPPKSDSVYPKLDLESVVKFLEDQLEVPNDR